MTIMAKAAASGGTGYQGAVGKVVILYGTVKAISPDGTVRVLRPNSLVFANDKIITESDGSVSIILDGTPSIHLDLGRMSQIVLNDDVLSGPGTPADAAAEADKVQQALLAGDQPIEPEAPAAGGEASAGGGHPVVNYSLTGEEVTPDSGAETRGIEFAPLEIVENDVDNGVELFDLTPSIDGGDASVNEDDLSSSRGAGESDGTDQSDPTTTTGDFRVSAPDGLDTVTIGGHLLISGGIIVGSGSFTTPLGNIFTITGYNPVTGVITYSYQLVDNEQHAMADGENSMFEDLTVVASDTDGDSATGTLSIQIIDDIPTEAKSETAMVEDEQIPPGIDEFWWWSGDLTEQTSGDIKDNVNWGADGFNKVTSFTIEGAEGEFAAGDTVYWAQDGTFLGKNDVDPQPAAASMLVNSDGTYTFKIVDNMLLGQDVQGEQIDTLAKVSIIGQDKDGDPQPVDVHLDVKDDKPSCFSLPDIVIAEDEQNLDHSGLNENPDLFPIPPFIGELHGSVTGTIADNTWWGADEFGGTKGFSVNGQIFEPNDTVYWDKYGNFLGKNEPSGDDGTDYAVKGDNIQNSEPAASLTVNADGTYTFTLLSNMLMGYGEQGEQTDCLAKVTITGQDGDGDKADVDVWLKVDDDVPCIDVKVVNEAAVILTTQDAETIGPDFDTAQSEANFSGVFTVSSSYGADGPGSVTPLSYELNIGVGYNKYLGASGLESDGDKIYLFKIGNDIVGSTAWKQSDVNDGNKVFMLSVDGDGKVTSTQYKEIDHDNNNDTSAPYDDQYEVMGSGILGLGLVTLTATATITDGDGDHATNNETIDLGGNIRFADDGPSVSANATVYLDDETAKTKYGTANPGGTDDYDGVTPPPATSGQLSHNYGADGAGSTLLMDTGAPTGFHYALSNGGKTMTISQNQGGNWVNVIEVKLTNTTDGNYEVKHLKPIMHSISGTAEENLDLTIKYKVTDGDDDKAFGELKIDVDDDVPSLMAAEAAAVVEDEQFNPITDEPNDKAPGQDYGASASGNVSDNGNWGADDFGKLTSFQVDSHTSVTVPDGGSVKMYFDQNGYYQASPTGAAASLEVFSNGNYNFKLSDNMLINSGQGELIDKLGTVTFTGQDKDGDQATITMDLKVMDDMPTGGKNNLVNLDDETASHTYAAPNDGGTDDYNGVSTTGGTLTHNYGADGARTTLLIGTDTLPAGFSSSITYGGKTLTISQMQNGQSVDVLKLTLSDTTSGNYTVEQLNPIFHPTPQVSEEERDFTIKYEVTDGDGDKVESNLSIRVDDDTPTIDVSSAVTFTLDVTNYGETSAGYDNSFGYYVKDADGNPTTGFVVWDNVKVYQNGNIEITGYTPDQIGFFIIPNGNNTNPGLASNTPVTFANIGGSWQAFAGSTPLVGEGANVLFDVKALNSDGFDHVQDNEKPGNLNWEDINGGGDQDWNDVNIGVVWSSNLPEMTTQDAETVGTAFDTDDASFSNAFNVAASPGADGGAAPVMSYSLNVTSSDSGLTSDGVSIILSMDGDDVVGKADENEIFRISVDAFGNVTLKQSAEIDHVDENADGNDFNNSANIIGLADGKISLTAAAMITDGDGDKAGDAQILDISSAIRFDDDLPTGGKNNLVNLDDETASHTYAAPNVDGTDDYNGVSTTGGTLTHNYGADGAGTTLFTGTDPLPAGFSSSIKDGGKTLTISQMQNGQSVDVLKLTLSDTTSGNYTVEQLNPISHPTPQVSEEERDFTIKYEVTDGDGDKVESDLNIRVDDDTPKAGDVFNVAQEGSGQDTNLMIILDLSGSMDSDPDGSGGFASRLDVAKDAIAKLIADYDALGDVMVRIVTFSSDSNPNSVSAAWMTATDALNYINGLSDYAGSGNTDYDAAIAAAQTAFASSGKIPDGMNVTYFLSDGNPNETNGTGTVGIVGAEETNWQNFLKANDIVTYALGMGSGSDIDYLKPIAYNGATEVNDDANLAIIVNDITNLPDVLSGTVGGNTTGNLLTDSSFGADGPGTLKIATISHDADGDGNIDIDEVYDASMIDPVTKELTITTFSGGSLTVNFATGEYSYTAPNITADAQEVFGFSVKDADGDPASAKLTIDVIAADDAPTAKDNYATGDEGTAGETANLVLVIDSSGSISSSELNLMKSAVTHLINDYGSNLVNVMLVDFDDSARVLTNGGQVWMTGDQAIAKLSSIGSGGNTDYDDAIAAVQNNYGTPPDADNTLVYFLSDGEPTGSDGWLWWANPNEISSSERQNWVNFLEDKGIDEVYAVGVGMGSGGETALNTVAWSSTGNQAANVFEIDSFDDLDATLAGTVPQPVTGNVITDNDTLGGGTDESGADGWDIPNLLVSAEYNGTIHNFLDADDSVTFNLINSGGKVTIEGDGDYTFTPGSDVNGDKTDAVKYTIEDSNGTTDSADLILTTTDLDSLVGGDPT